MIDNPWGNNSDNKNSENEDNNAKKSIKKTQEKVIDYMKFSNKKQNNHFGMIYVVLLLLALAWLSTGFFTVDTDEEGIVMRFGKYNREVKPGLKYKLPSPIETVEKVSVTRVKKDIIGKITNPIGFSKTNYLGGDNDKQNETDLSYPKESQMLTGDENIIDMHFYVQWKIVDPKDYLFNIRDSKSENIVRSAAESVMRQVISEVTLSEALSEKRLLIEQDAKKGLQKIMDSYHSGIGIVSVGILYSYVGPEVRDAYRDVQSAKADRERFINQAQAYRNEIIPRAKGEAATLVEEALAYKESTISKAKGEASKFNEIYKAYSVDKDITKKRMYLDTMEKVYQNTTKVIIDKDIAKGILPFLPLNKMDNKQ
jgi:membrane protease subunit HflK